MIGSGLDLPQLVSQLVGAARKPAAERITGAGNVATAKLSAFSKIKQSLESLNTALTTVIDKTGTPAFSSKVPDQAGFTASASAKAVAGHYQIEVVRLASAHKLASAAYPSDAQPGAGTLKVQAGQHAISVDVAEGASLADIAKAINDAADGKGVSASVVSADDGQHLVLNARETGQAQQVSVSATGAAGLQALADGLKTQTPAQDALVRADGFERTLAGNTVDDLIPGVSLTLTRAAPGETFELGISADTGALKSSLNELAKAWNASMALLKTSSAYEPETRKAAVLTGDSLVRGLQQQLRGQVSADLAPLKALGVTLDKNGEMHVDETAFDKAIAADPGAAKAVLGREGHYAKALGQLLDGQLDSVDGSLTLRHKSLDKQIKGYTAQMEALDARMHRLSDLYTAQFAAMERMIVQMQSSASGLDNLLAATAK